jgi:hypothetical protein
MIRVVRPGFRIRIRNTDLYTFTRFRIWFGLGLNLWKKCSYFPLILEQCNFFLFFTVLDFFQEEITEFLEQFKMFEIKVASEA